MFAGQDFHLRGDDVRGLRSVAGMRDAQSSDNALARMDVDANDGVVALG